MHESLSPILPGFYSDPTLCRVGSDFYLACSSFEYFPGIPLFHSRDLRRWTQLDHILTRPSQLPLDRAWISGGIYAPTLRHHAGRFYLITTNVSPDKSQPSSRDAARGRLGQGGRRIAGGLYGIILSEP